MSFPNIATRRKRPAEPARPALRTRTILVVEDRADDIELLQDMFRRSGILNPLQVVETVHDTICYLKGEGIYNDRDKYPFPALILLDLHLPDGTGFDVLQWLDLNRARCPVAAVVLTGSDLKAIKRSYSLGAHSFLVKPLKFEDFANMVMNVRGIKLTRTSEGQVLELDL